MVLRENIKIDKKNILLDLFITFFFLFNSGYITFFLNEYIKNIDSIFLYQEICVYLLNSVILAFFYMFFSVVELQIYSQEGEMENFSISNYSRFFRRVRGVFIITYIANFFLTSYLFVFSTYNIFTNQERTKYMLQYNPHLFAEFIIVSSVFYINLFSFLLKYIILPFGLKVTLNWRKKYIMCNFKTKSIREECPICLEIGDYNKKITNCDHFFHRECLEKLFELNNILNCPICREKIY